MLLHSTGSIECLKCNTVVLWQQRTDSSTWVCLKCGAMFAVIEGKLREIPPIDTKFDSIWLRASMDKLSQAFFDSLRSVL